MGAIQGPCGAEAKDGYADSDIQRGVRIEFLRKGIIV